MSLKHLTDEEIQNYLDGNLSRDIALLTERHLETCPLCREAVKQYQGVYAGLDKEEGFELSKGFAKSVVKMLPPQGETKSPFDLLNVFLTILGVIVAAGVTIYYVDLRPLGRAFSHILPGPQLGSGVVAFVEDLLIGFNGNLGLLILGVLTLVIIGGLDRLLLQPRYRRVRF
ncbi:MAG: zf-HC2 domain-containing protein [Candidatus Zixiibacteriota bacterium]